MDQLKFYLFHNISPWQTVAKNTFWMYFAEISSKGLRLISFLLITRILGPENFGILEYFLSFIGLFFILGDFGISAIFIRDYQQKENKTELINNFFSLKIIFSLIFGLLAFGGYFLTKRFDGFLIYSILVIFYILQNIEGFFETYFVTIQKTEKKFIFNFVSSIFLLLWIFFGFFLSRNIFVVALGYLLSIFLSIVLAYFFYLKEKTPPFQFNFSLARYLVFSGLPVALFGILSTIYFYTDRIFITHWQGSTETGYYSLASRILSAFLVLGASFNAALYPLLAKRIKERNPSLIKNFRLIITGSILFALLLSFLVFLLVPILIPLIFGTQFINSILITQIMIWLLVFYFPKNFLDNFLISTHHQWTNFLLTLIPAITNISLNFIFVPLYGALGAVYTSLISQFLNFILMLIVSVNILKKIYQGSEKE